MKFKTKWKRIEKELPKKQRMVFVAMEGNEERPNYFAAVVYQDGKFGTSQTGWTHWMYPPRLTLLDLED
jgi:hypothetical protein